MGVYQSATEPKVQRQSVRYSVGILEMAMSGFTEKQYMRMVQRMLDVPRRVLPRKDQFVDHSFTWTFEWWEVVTT